MTQLNGQPLFNDLPHRFARVAVGIAFAAIVCAMPARTFGAKVLNGDFDSSSPTYSGTAAAPDPGTFWNSLNGSGSVGTMIYSDGSTTSPITVSITGNSGAYYYGAFGTLPAADLLNDGAMMNVPTQVSTLTFNSVPAGNYDLYLYSVDSVNYNSQTTFTFGSSQSVNNTGSATWVLGDNYALFAGLTPVAGVITGTWTDNVSGTLILNGFQLVSVPEPASLSLLVISAAGLLSRRRRVA